MYRKIVLWAIFLLFFPLTASGVDDPFSVNWDNDVKKVGVGEVFQVSFVFQIPPDHYLYHDKTYAIPEDLGDFEIVKARPLLGHRVYDPFFDKVTSIIEGDAEIIYWLRSKEGISSGEKEIRFKIGYQGCSKKLCYRLVEEEAVVPISVSGGTSPGIGSILAKSDLLAYGTAFAAGILTNFTPCVLPLIPLLLFLIGISKESSFKTNFFLSLTFASGMAITYSLIGLAASAFGLALGFLFQSPVFTFFVVILYLTLALSLFGVFEFQLPLKVRNSISRLGGRGYKGAIVAGMVCGFLAAPCVGPVIGGILIYALNSQRVVFGTSLLFVFALGMGSVFMIVGTFARQLVGKFRSSGVTVIIQRLMGALLLIPAIYYGTIFYNQITSTQPASSETPVKDVEKWILEEEKFLSAAREKGKGVVIDFFARWCIPCLELDKTFKDEEVKKALFDFDLIRIDCTEYSDQCRYFVRKYGVVGWPTILFIDPEGKVMNDHTIVGETLNPGEMIEHLKKTRQDF